MFAVPELTTLDPGVRGIERWTSQVRPLAPPRHSAREPTQLTERRGAASRLGTTAVSSAISSLPPVLIVGGKGGVGKTSVSCALALASARDGHRTILVSTDPAPSIGDALDQRIEDADTLVAGGFGLYARQIDADAAFARWRSEYQSRVDAAFDGLLGPGLDASHDRAIARELFALAPPGIDELYALIWLGDALAEGVFSRIVIDPAPTGHLIRLLEMPALALDWSHRLLRLMLKYRELAGGGELGAELLAFARRTRLVGELLRDRERAGVLVVALDETNADSGLGQVERDARPDDPTADDHDVGGRRQSAHRRTRFFRKNPRFAGRSASRRMRYGYQSGPNGAATSTL